MTKKKNKDKLITGESLDALPIPKSKRTLIQNDKLDYEKPMHYFRYFKLQGNNNVTYVGMVLKDSSESKPLDAEWISPEEYISIKYGDAELRRIKGKTRSMQRAIWVRELTAIREMENINNKLRK